MTSHVTTECALPVMTEVDVLVVQKRGALHTIIP